MLQKITQPYIHSPLSPYANPTIQDALKLICCSLEKSKEEGNKEIRIY